MRSWSFRNGSATSGLISALLPACSNLSFWPLLSFLLVTISKGKGKGASGCTQEMANYISLELARGMAKVPAYTPFIVPDISASPWAITAKEHVAAVVRWRGNSRQGKKDENSSAIPMQAWLLYQLRFLVAADLAGAWSAFGGLAAQLNHLSIVMNMSIVDSATVALAYDRLVREFLAERARSRHELNGPSFFSDFLSVENPALKLKALAEHPRGGGAPRDQPSKAELQKQKKEAAAAAKAAAAAASSAKDKGRGSPKRDRQQYRQDRGRDRYQQPRSRTRSRSRRNRSQRKASPKKKSMKKR